MSNEIFETVSSIIKETLSDDSLMIKYETSATDIEQWDSLTHLQMIAAIEKKFKIRFALGELQDLQNVGDMIQLIQAKLSTHAV